jgi:hypothetical protein
MTHYAYGEDYTAIQIGDTIENYYGEVKQVVRTIGKTGFSLYNPEYKTLSFMFRYDPEKVITAVTA